MTDHYSAIAAQFRLDSPAVSACAHGNGHINKTVLLTTASGTHYILQKLNHHVFRDIPALMENVCAVTAHLQKKAADPRQVLQFLPSLAGEPYLFFEEEYWRVMPFVEDALCLDTPRTPQDFYESGVAFGRFQDQLSDFPAQTLHETIPNFHNTPDRYRIFREVLSADPCGRAHTVQREIDFYLAREQEAGTLVSMQQAGLLPLRVTHNDTKLNNVMLDSRTGKALCVIDLDTVMPGLSLYDFGDSIRFGAATAAEDEQDLDKVETSLELYETYARGFLTACPALTAQERAMLPMGAKLMTLECGLRFLTDYLDGDHYFSVQRDGQNLDRCRTQMKLVADMEKKWDALQSLTATL